MKFRHVLITGLIVLFIILVLSTTINSEVGKSRNLLEIRSGFHTSFSRVVFDLDGPCLYKIENDQRSRYLLITLLNTSLARYYDNQFKFVDDGVVSSLSVRQEDRNIKVTINAKSNFRYSSFQLDNPFRIVVDVYSIRKNSVSNQTREKIHSGIKEGTIPEPQKEPMVTDSLAVVPCPPTGEKKTSPTEESHSDEKEGREELTDLEPPETQLEVEPATVRKFSQGRIPLLALVFMTLLLNIMLFGGIQFIWRKNGSAQSKTNSLPKKTRAITYPITQPSLALAGGPSSNVETGSWRPLSATKRVAELYSMVGTVPSFRSKRSSRMPPKNYADVCRLAAINWSARDIARELKLGQDEVRLVLNLSRNQRSRRTSDNPIPAKLGFAL